MKKVELDIYGIAPSQIKGSYSLILSEVSGERKLPIIVGQFEAQAIAIEIEKIIPNRPMTHDLFKSFADSFQFEIDRIVISDMKEGVFYAKIHCKNTLTEVEIDSRPSYVLRYLLAKSERYVSSVSHRAAVS